MAEIFFSSSSSSPPSSPKPKPHTPIPSRHPNPPKSLQRPPPRAPIIIQARRSEIDDRQIFSRHRSCFLFISPFLLHLLSFYRGLAVSESRFRLWDGVSGFWWLNLVAAMVDGFGFGRESMVDGLVVNLLVVGLGLVVVQFWV